MDYYAYTKTIFLVSAIIYFIAGNMVYSLGIGPIKTREQRTACLFLGSITCLLGIIVIGLL